MAKNMKQLTGRVERPKRGVQPAKDGVQRVRVVESNETAVRAEPLEATALELSTPQRIAMEKLTLGETLVDAAHAAGITRMTLYRWLKQDPHFAAAYNAWQQDALATARGRLLALTDAAVTTVGSAMRSGDARAALAVLKAMGVMDRPTPGPTDPELVRREQKIEEGRAYEKSLLEGLEYGV